MMKHFVIRDSLLPALILLALTACNRQSKTGLSDANPIQQQVSMKTFHDFKVKDIAGQDFDLARFKGSKVLVVNTASECGYTPQYAQLEELSAAYAGDSFALIGFPCNDFGAQEPGTEAEIAAFCSANYGISFPMMSKVSIRGEMAHPLYQWLQKKEMNGKEDYQVAWNFSKFLINEDGSIETMYPSSVSPLDEKILSWLKH